MPDSTATKCPHCDDALIPGKMYCPNCGQALAPPEQKAAIDAYVVAKVGQEVALRMQNESAIVRDIGYKAENEVRSRIKLYSWISVIALALLAAYGIKSISDAQQKIVDEARGRVEPAVHKVEERANAAQQILSDVDRKLPAVKDSLDRIATLADTQRGRIENQSADVNSKLTRFESSASRVDQLIAAFDAKISASEKRFDEMTKRYDTRLDQISRSATHSAVSEVYPNLDEEPFISIRGLRFDRADKKPTERWVDVYLTDLAVRKHTISTRALESLIADLQAAGFTPLLGLIGFGGRTTGIIERVGPGPYTESGVLYFRPAFKPAADQLVTICRKYIQLPPSSPQLADTGEGRPLAGGADFIRKDGKLDAQIFVSAEQ